MLLACSMHRLHGEVHQPRQGQHISHSHRCARSRSRQSSVLIGMLPSNRNLSLHGRIFCFRLSNQVLKSGARAHIPQPLKQLGRAFLSVWSPWVFIAMSVWRAASLVQRSIVKWFTASKPGISAVWPQGEVYHPQSAAQRRFGSWAHLSILRFRSNCTTAKHVFVWISATVQ